jgi:hypothetical protein
MSRSVHPTKPAPISCSSPAANPTLGDLEDRTVDEEVTLEFDALATDLESPNDILSFSLDPGRGRYYRILDLP